ncbi:MAG: PIN-like domain-containing protein [Alcanivorax sp.]|uniref:PIN-like domain-containing protein n=1 Tax=Alcanivorax sp. TaxID=1872427 RepID=UPI003DA75D0B
MKEVFKGFYNIDDSLLEELWGGRKTIFVFDANVLLNLYGYAKQTREDFFRILEALGDRLWIPYHVGLEYQRRRLAVIRNEKVIFNEIEKNLKKIQNVFKGDFEKLALARRFPKLFENTEKLEKEISKSIASYRKSVNYWDNEQPCVRSHDEIRDRLNLFFDGKVGERPENQEWLDSIFEDGNRRFKNKVPPGFKDEGKGDGEDSLFSYDGLYYERKYGDLIIWKQLIDKAKNEDVESVVFVTDDAKEDWWYKIDSNGKKIVGPLAELQSELYRESSVDCFHMYSTSKFLEDGKSKLSVDVSESSIEDAESIHDAGFSTHYFGGHGAKTILGGLGESMSSEMEIFRNNMDAFSGGSSIQDERIKSILAGMRESSLPDLEKFNDSYYKAISQSLIDNERLDEIMRKMQERRRKDEDEDGEGS